MSKQAMPKRKKPSMRVLGRALKMLFSYYPVLMPITVLCILISAVTAALPPVFMQQVIAEIETAVKTGSDWAAASKIIIAQRVASVEDADLILVMENGRVASAGTHEQLLASSEIYREIYEQQTKGGKENE